MNIEVAKMRAALDEAGAWLNDMLVYSDEAEQSCDDHLTARIRMAMLAVMLHKNYGTDQKRTAKGARDIAKHGKVVNDMLTMAYVVGYAQALKDQADDDVRR